MDKLYTTTAVVVGGRNGHVKSDDGIIDMDMRSPKELGGGDGHYANPETLFAAGYAACFNSALMLAARKKKLNADDAEVKVSISIGRDETSYKLAAHIEGMIPGMTPQKARELMEDAHQLCPYSKATRGNIDVELSVRNK